ncbi:hypothetical protein V8F20_002860 [Naviculisporaceae sp. PSN 640]
MAHSENFLPFGPLAPSLDDADDKRARDVAWWAKAILIWLIQIVGVSAAVIFGMFSTLAWQNSEIAKSQADSANLLSMVALCTQLDERDEHYLQLCESIKIAAQGRLRALADSMFGDLPRPTTTRTRTSTASSTSTSEYTPTTVSFSTTEASSTSTEFTTSAPTTLFTTATDGGEPPLTTSTERPTGPTPALMFFISIISLVIMWPAFKKARRNRRSVRAEQARVSANVGSGQR